MCNILAHVYHLVNLDCFHICFVVSCHVGCKFGSALTLNAGMGEFHTGPRHPLSGADPESYWGSLAFVRRGELP